MSKNTGFINTIQNYRFGNYRKKTKKAAKIGRLLPGSERMVTVKTSFKVRNGFARSKYIGLRLWLPS